MTFDGIVVFDALGTPSLGWALLQEIRKTYRQEDPVGGLSPAISQNGRIPFMNSDDVATTQWLRALDEVGKTRSEIHHSRPWQDVQRRKAGDRLYP